MGRPENTPDGAARRVNNVGAGTGPRSSSGVLLMEVRTTGSLLVEANSSVPSALHRGICELSEQGLIFGV